MARTMSTFLVLHTPVTSVPNDLAICTANVPTPPAAPLMRICILGPVSSRKLHTGKPYVQFERRTEASAQARLLRPDISSQVSATGGCVGVSATASTQECAIHVT